ncbi:MAG: hypothetical protein Q9210_004076, partial [Variospora velana]
MLVLDSLNFLSTDSRCWSFDERANGYGRGEGIAVVVLKRLTDAVRDGDTIRAVIRATALNQDGRTPGITQPSGRMQEVLIRDTYRRAGLDMSITRFFEAHGTGEERLPQDSEVYLFRGTGTAVGDPIEAAAIGNSFKKHRTPEKPLYVGAVKSNIGHLEGASGIAGLIKTILVLEKGVIPPNAGFEYVNPRIDPTDLHIQFPLRSIPWLSRGFRRVSLNSFGFGGSNAHVVVDDAYYYLKSRGLTGRYNTVYDLGSPPSDTDQSVVVADYHPIMEGNNFRGSKLDEASPILLVWSTADEEGMKRLSSLYEKYFRDDSHWSENANLKSLAYTLVAKRTALTWKSFLVAPDIARLRAVNSNLSKAVRSSDKRGIVFVFTGQEAQYARIGQGLIQYPTFSESLRQSEAALYAIGCLWSLLESLHMEGDNSLIDRPEYSQSVCTALQIALIDLLRKFNIHPVAVIGHSSGEIAAAYCIGAISRTSALRLAYCRGVLAARLASSGDVSGAMMSIGLSETNAHAYLERLQDVYGSVDITVGCINSPTNVTITGDRKQIDTLESILRENSVFVRRLAINMAYHSRHMEYVATEYSTLIQDLEVGHTAATTLSVLFSTVAATQVSALQLRQSEYWVNNMVSPVRFSETLARVCTQSGRLKRKRLGQPLQHQLIVTDVLELGPRSALKAPIREILRIVPNSGAIQYHSALVRDADATQNLLKMNGTAIYPAAGMLVMAIEATRQLARIGDKARGFQFRNVVFLRALTVSLQAENTEVQFSLRALKESSGKEEAGFEFRLWVLEGEDWAVCCYGHIRPEYEREINEIDAGQELLKKTLFCERAVRDGFAACNQSISATQLYQVFNDIGAGYGLTFQVLEDVCHNGTDTTAAKVKLRQWTEKGNGIYEQPHVIHPTTLDGLFQLIVPALSQGGRSRIPTMVPTRINRLWVAASGLSDHNDSMIRACALSRFKGYRETESSVVAVSSSESAPRIVMEGLETTFVTNNQSSDAKEDKKRHLCCHLHWRLDLDLMDNAQIQEFCKATRPAEPPLQAAFYEDLRLAIFSFIQEAVDHVNGKDRAGFEPHIVPYDHMARVQMHTDFRTALLEKIQQISTEGRFFVKVGRNLISMLDGVVDPLDLLFKGDLVERYYHELNGAPHTFMPFATYLDTLAYKNPSMKILEIGAGIGGATLPILDVLKHHGDKEAGWPRFAEYDFTDVSPAFFEAAREKFGNGLERMSFKTLDIEKDPLAQGYEEGTYDLIIAANVLHATQDLSGALVNTRRLLKPGCPLVLFEVTEPHVMQTGFAFGLLKGWWLATQEDGRWSPCLSEEAWNDAMSRTGFLGLDIVLPDSREEACHEASILITTARMEEPADPVVMLNIVIVLDEECPMQQDLAQELYHWLPSMGELTWETSSLQEVAQRTDLAGVFCILLLEIGEPFLSSINKGQFAQLKDLIKSNGSLLWVTQERSDIIRRPDFDMVTGFAKALKSEYSQLSFVTLALDNSRHPHTGNALANAAQKVIKVLQRTVSLPAELAELDYAEREGPALSLHVPSPGLLDSLEFREDKDLLRTMGSDKVEVEVMATGVNFRDCLIALDNMSFVEATALPTVGITAYHALYNVARLSAGESILIHSGAGGTGQLAIQIAQHLQAIVYVTVSSEAKKRLLMDKYTLPDDCFFYSRDNSFAQGIKRVTHGRGVDVVLNSLSGDSLTASWDCVAPFGRFVEIGKKDILAHADLPMFRFAKNVTFAAVNLADIIRERPGMMQDLFQGMMALLEQGSISAAQPVHVFPASKITTAFRALQGGKHVGKIVIEYSKDDLVPTLLDNKPAYFFHSNASYLIAGGLGGLGRSITQWMASRGARYFILLSRSGARSSEAKALHEELHSQGCRVETPACDIAHEQTLKEVLDRCAETMPPIRGCMQATMVLKDTIFENMTHADFTLSTAPKAAGSWNLHKLLPRNLDHFILLSSITGIFGAPSQANYTAGNTYQDALAAHRLALGERAAALDLGMMTSAGILAQNHALRALLARTGFFMPITQPELFALLDHYCNPDLPLVHQPAQYCQPIVGIELPAVLEQQGRDIPAWMHRPLFRHFFAMRPRHASESAASGSSSSVSDSLAARLRHAATDDAVAELITHALAEKTVRILGVRMEDLDTAKPLYSFGVDSLVAVEIRNWIGREVGVEVGIFDLLGGRS